MKDTYKNRFSSKAAAQEYVSLYSDENDFSNCIFPIEKAFLESVIRGCPDDVRQWRYLDFAVGTGRIISILEEYFASSEGIDISAEMAKVASSKVKTASIRVGDITKESADPAGFQLITAFRFFLNAEPELREAVLPSLCQRLAGSDAMLILNNHGRPCSIKIFSFMKELVRTRLFGKTRQQNFLSDGEIESLIHRNGLSIERTFGYAVLGNKLSSLLSPAFIQKVETAAAGTWFGRVFGINRIYILRKS